MTESNDGQNEAERDQRVADPQSENHERTREQFDERDDRSDKPKRPDRQESIGEWEKIFSSVFEGAELKDFPEAGHEENQAENQPGK